MVMGLAVICIFCCTSYVCYYLLKFHNDYKLTIIIGRKGAGKTTMLTRYAVKYKKKGWNVYSNFPIPGTYLYDASKIGLLQFPPDSLVLCDEIGLVFNNRSFKTFPKEAISWFKLQRHYRVRFIACSQADDYDKSIRNLVDSIYILSNLGNVIGLARKVNRTVGIVQAKDAMGESKIVEDLNFSPWFMIPFGGVEITWIPKYSKFFDSYDAPMLPLENFVYLDERTDLYHVNIFSRISSFFRGHFPFFDNTSSDQLPISQDEDEEVKEEKAV